MTMMEDPDLTNEALRRLLRRCADRMHDREAARGKKSRWTRAGR